MRSQAALVVLVCLTEALGMTASATFPTLIPTFREAWSINNTQAGWVSGVFFGGYVIAVAVLTALTDRMSAKRIYLLSMALSACSAAGFALAADGVWSASLWRVLQGIGLAGTYMPGLKALTDQLPDRLHSRATAFYTASFGLGTSLSYFLSGLIVDSMGWRWAFGLCALGPAAALALAWLIFEDRAPPAKPPDRHLLDFRPVLRNRRALGFTLAYCAHNTELFAFRSWIVAYLVFSQSQQIPGAGGAGWHAASVAALINLIGMPSSVLGNELAARVGRQWTAIAIMCVSALIGLAFGLVSAWPYWIVVGLAFIYGIAITGESATLTAGLVKVADPRHKGATMAMHSVVGFVGSFLGPIGFGVVLDAAGGEQTAGAWAIAFALTSLVALTGPAALARFTRVKHPIY